jgi:uncharacterized paraquat-inducible protein A
MVTKGWCENCQIQSNGALYCPQCGEGLQDKQQPSLKIMFVGSAIAVAWLLFLALWLFFYASGFSIVQNTGILVLSLVVVLILEWLLMVPFTREEQPRS